jgi:hypothetical protein
VDDVLGDFRSIVHVVFHFYTRLLHVLHFPSSLGEELPTKPPRCALFYYLLFLHPIRSLYHFHSTTHRNTNTHISSVCLRSTHDKQKFYMGAT